MNQSIGTADWRVRMPAEVNTGAIRSKPGKRSWSNSRAAAATSSWRRMLGGEAVDNASRATGGGMGRS